MNLRQFLYCALYEPPSTADWHMGETLNVLYMLFTSLLLAKLLWKMKLCGDLDDCRKKKKKKQINSGWNTMLRELNQSACSAPKSLPLKVLDIWKSTTSRAGTFWGANFYPELYLDPGSCGGNTPAVSQFQEGRERTCVLVETSLARFPWKNELGRTQGHRTASLWELRCTAFLLNWPHSLSISSGQWTINIT